MKKNYLVKETTLFVDPHGDIDVGGTLKRVEFTDVYNNLDLSKTYNQDLKEVNENDYYGSEDGYNAQYTELDIIEITEAQLNEYTKIIDSFYNL